MGYDLVKRHKALDLEVGPLVVWAVRNLAAVKCVQIGANDGVLQDPLKLCRRNPAWRTWLLEPQPAIFSRLKKNVADEPGSVCLPYALAETPGKLRIYVVDEEAVVLVGSDGKRHDFSLHTSTNENKLREEVTVLMRMKEIPESWIRAVDVTAIDWNQLLDGEVGDAINVVLMDAEGMDATLLRAFPFSRRQPEVVVFEHMWMDRDDFQSIRKLLEGAGYRLMSLGTDTVALKIAVMDRSIDAVTGLCHPPVSKI
jgi:FkbM family methyltransferase